MGRIWVWSVEVGGSDGTEKCHIFRKFVFQLQLWDTAGQERFRKSMVAHYYRNVHAVVFVYDVTKLSSFESLPIWVQECNRHHLTYAIPRILVGNKSDLTSGRSVDTARAQKFADLHNMPVSTAAFLQEFYPSDPYHLNLQHFQLIFSFDWRRIRAGQKCRENDLGIF